MPVNNLTPALTGQGRVFINVDGAGCGKPFTFYNCMKVDGLDKSLGDITSIFCPDPERYDEFVEIASIKGADSRWTSTLSGKLPLDEQSALEELLNQGCAFNAQIHYGRCTRPDDFTSFESAIILQDVRLTSYALSTLTATTPEERAAIDETAAISIGNVYRLFTPSVTETAIGTLAGDGVFGIQNADTKSCGDVCTNRSTGCDVWIGPTFNVAQNVSFIYTTDGGVTWNTTLAGTEVHEGTQAQSGYVISGAYAYTAVFSSNDTIVYRTTLASIVSGTPDTEEILVIAGETPRGLVATENYIWVIGGTGNSIVQVIEKSTLEVTVIDDGVLFPASPATSIYAMSDDVVLIGSDNGAYAYSSTFGVFTTGAIPLSPANTLTDLRIFNTSNWIAVGEIGIYCTADGGTTWSLVQTVAGTPSFGFYDDIVGYMQDNSGIYRTIDSGNNWTLLHATVEANQQTIVPCSENPNMFISAGGNAGAGYIYLGAT